MNNTVVTQNENSDKTFSSLVWVLKVKIYKDNICNQEKEGERNNVWEK